MATCFRELEYMDESGVWQNASLKFFSSSNMYEFDIGGKKINLSDYELESIVGLIKILNRFDSVFPCTHDEEYNSKMIDEVFNDFCLRHPVGNKT